MDRKITHYVLASGTTGETLEKSVNMLMTDGYWEGQI